MYIRKFLFFPRDQERMVNSQKMPNSFAKAFRQLLDYRYFEPNTKGTQYCTAVKAVTMKQVLPIQI